MTLIAISLVLAITVPSGPSPAAPSSPFTDAAAASTTCRSTAATSIGDVMAERLTDVATLAFIRLLETASVTQRADVLSATQGPPPAVPVASAHAAAIANRCPYDAAIARDRMAYAVRAYWRDEAISPERHLEPWLAFVADALAARSALTPSIVATALAPFHASVAELERTSSPDGAPGGCPPDRDAVADDKVQPDYPNVARRASASGSVQVEVELDRDGDVVAVTPARSTVPSDPGGDALRDATLRAAAVTTYSAAVTRCRAIPGRYPFTAVFSSQ